MIAHAICDLSYRASRPMGQERSFQTQLARCRSWIDPRRLVFIDEGWRNTLMKMVASRIAELEMKIMKVFASDFALSEAVEREKMRLQADTFKSGRRARN